MSGSYDYSGLIEKTRKALRIQPYGTDAELARQIGVEPETVRRAKMEQLRPGSTMMFKTQIERALDYLCQHPDASYKQVMETVNVGLETIRKARQQLIKNGVCIPKHGRARKILLEQPNGDTEELSKMAGCSVASIRKAKRKLRKEGKLKENET